MIIEKIVIYTNYRLQNNVKDVQETSFEEIEGFCGILLLLGVLKKKHIEINEIWSSKYIHYSQNACATMSNINFDERNF